MYKKRIHNSYGFQWTLLKDGDPLDLTGKDLIIVMRSDLDAVQMEHLIVEGNVISWTWPGTAQKFCGKYDAVLIEDKDTAGMAVIDTEAAIELVAHTWEESDLAPSTIELQTVVSLVPGPQGVGIDRIVYNQDYTLTIYLTDGSHYTTGNIRGEKGDEPVITADAEGNIYVDGELLTSIIKVVAELATSAAADASAKAAQASAAATAANSAASSAGTAATNANTKAALAEAAAGTANTAAAGADAKAALAQAAADNADAKAALAATAAGTANTAAAGADTSAANADAKATLADNAATSATSAAASASGAAATAVEKAALADTAAATANAAAEAADEAREGIQDDLARKANIDGYYEQMAVGLAKAIEGVTPVTESFMERTTGGDAEVANGLAQMIEVAGRSQQWNQLCKIRDSSASTTTNGVTLVDNRDGSFTVSTVSTGATAATVLGCVRTINTIAGHKCLLIGCPTGGSSSTYRLQVTGIYSSGDNTDKGNGGIFTWLTSSAYLNYPTIWVAAGAIITTPITFWPQVIDLTLLGIDNLTTVAEVKAWLAKNIGAKQYYPFNEGTVLNNKMTGLESLGRNLLDPTTGKARIIGAYSDVYDNYYKIIGTHGALTFTSDWGEERVITPDANGEFRLLESGWLTVATPGADCSVFLWYDGTKTDYSEYTRDVAGLDLFHIWGKLNGAGELVRIWPDGQAGINDVKDVLRVENGVTVARKRIGTKKIQDIGVILKAAGVFQVGLAGRKYAAGNYNAISSIYATYTEGHSTGSNIETLAAAHDKSLFLNSGSATSFISDSAYSTLEAFMAAKGGVEIFYELATEQLYTDLVYQGSSLFADGTPVVLPVNYNGDNWSIERVIPQNDTAVVTAVPEISCKYSIDIVETTNTQGDEIDDLYENKAGKEGSYPNMSVGSAKTLEGDDPKVEDFTFTPIQAAEGLAKLNGVRGNSLVFNQLVANGDFSNGTTGWTIAIGTVSDGIFTSTPLAEVPSSTKTVLTQSFGSVPVGHKMYMFGYYRSTHPVRLASNGVLGAGIDFPASDVFIPMAYIGTVINSNSLQFSVGFPRDTAIGATVSIKSAKVTDLTLMFGEGKEPATVDEFVKFYPNLYYAQNDGTILNNKTEQVVSEGFNQWDEEWELGYYNDNTGLPTASTSQIRSKNTSPIPVFPDTAYCFTCLGERVSRIFWYDSEGNFISNSGNSTESVFVVTSPSNARYCKFQYPSAYGTTYQNDICVNLSDTSRNGTYEPYKKSVTELGLTTLTGKLNGEGASVTVFPDGLRKAGTAYDEAAGSRAYVRIASYTFTGNESVVQQDTSNKWVFKNILTGAGASGQSLVCDKFAGVILANGSSYPNAAVFPAEIASTSAEAKSAVAGATVYYPLAEPQTYVLDTPIPEGIQAYKGGTLKQLPENGSVPTTAPCVLSVTYPMDVQGIIQKLPQDYISKESLTAMLAAMQSAGLFAGYTMTWDETNGRYAFTFTPNSNE